MLAAADGVDLLLGRFQHVARGGAALLHHGSDVGCGGGHLPHQRLVPHDLYILIDIGGGRRHLHQLQQIGAGGFGIGAVFLHFAGNRHAVHRLGVDEHVGDGLKDLPVLPQVEILRLQLIHHILDTIAVDQHGAQHRLLRLGGVGHAPHQQFVHHHTCLLQKPR